MLHRSKLVLEFWDRSRELSINNKEYRDFVKNLFFLLLKNDSCRNDTTTNTLIGNEKVSAAIIAKEGGILAGIEELEFLNSDLKIKPRKQDGDKIKAKDVLLEISGDAEKILGRERMSLNLLQRMSGIATLTNELSKRLKNKSKIAATRKTVWGCMDKKAVSIGGGLTHRLNLSDGIIVKDNHLKLLNHNIEKALKLAKNRHKYAEIEVENKKQALIAAKAIKKLIGNGAKNLFAIMFDKMPPADIKSIVWDLKDKKLHDYVLFEASGNIKPENIHEYADCGVDAISMGCITNSAKALDMSMEIIK